MGLRGGHFRGPLVCLPHPVKEIGLEIMEDCTINKHFLTISYKELIFQMVKVILALLIYKFIVKVTI